MTLSELILKPLESEQLNAVVELDKLCFGGLWTLAGYQRELASPNSQLLVINLAPGKHRRPQQGYLNQKEYLVALGCFWAILDEAHITILAVHPHYQGQGIGQLLLLELLRQAVKRKLKRATLEVKASNEKAEKLYKKFDFSLVGKRKGYYQKTKEDALIFWHSDIQSPEFAQKLAAWELEVKEKLSIYHWRWARETP